jgi:hypothetical protein
MSEKGQKGQQNFANFLMWAHMGKKSLKKQQKQPSMADFDNTAPPAITTTSQPASNPQVDNAHAPTTTQLSFRDFLTIANTEDIKKFLRVAVTTPEGANLFYLWKRAYDSGWRSPKREKITTREFRKEDEGKVWRRSWGMNLGREQGYTIVKEAFDKMIVAIKARNTPKVDTADISTQTNSVVTTGISVQTTALSMTHSTSGTQTNTMITTSHPTTDVFVQTDLELSGNGKNAKMDFAPGFSLSIPKISLTAPHATSSDSVAPFTTTPALETR